MLAHLWVEIGPSVLELMLACSWQLSIAASVLVGRSVYLPSNLSDLEYPRSGANHLVGRAGSRH